MVDVKGAGTQGREWAGREEQLREAIELFYFAYRSFTAGPDRILKEQELGRVHHRILYFVGRNPDIAVSELLAILAVSKQALNLPLRRLLELELVSARPSPRDRRVKLLRLSQSGEALEGRLTATQMAHLGAVFDACGEEALRGWREVMLALPRDRSRML